MSLALIFGLVYIRISHFLTFPHISQTRNWHHWIAHINFTRGRLWSQVHKSTSSPIFGFVYISSHIFSHILEPKFGTIRKPLMSAFQKYILLLWSRAILSVQRPLKPKKGENGRFLGVATPIKKEHADEFFWNLAKRCPVWVPKSVPKRKKKHRRGSTAGKKS